MNFDNHHYVPCLRWKTGEYQAVFRLPATTKRLFTPLIEVPGIGYDFENERKAKTLDQHLAPFAKRVHEKWGRQPCFVDLNLIESNERMATGIHPAPFVFDGLRGRRCSAIPVTGLDRDSAYQQEIRKVVTKNKSGVCLRIKIQEAAKDLLKDNLDSLLSRFKVKPESCDLIIDLGAPNNFVPLKGFLGIIQTIASKIPYLNNWRTFTLIGTSFPESMGGIMLGVTNIPRYEWKIYKILVESFRKAKIRLPTFGDYAISNPNVPDLDWRVVKPTVKIRYTIDDSWYIAKGKNYRDFGYGQYHELSKKILDSDYYYGQTFSWGDKYIQQCANGGKTGNLTMWLEVDTNHHIEKVIRDVASYYDS